ncbi:MAG TPA: response regulator transcription factor [Puia sp.]|nr:response regulator transcription factor [Puia sp.]
MIIKKTKVAVADDHTLLRKALSKLISSYEGYTVLFEAENGIEVKTKITQHSVPDILLLDVNMPGMDGFDTVQWIHKNYPHIKVLALSMFSDEKIIIRMLRLGAKGYVLKNIDPEELKNALDSVVNKDFYLPEYISGKIISGLNRDGDELDKQSIFLTEKEKEFLQLICSELTYKDIAIKLNLSPRTIDDYRNALFDKFSVKSRVGLAIYAIKKGLVVV